MNACENALISRHPASYQAVYTASTMYPEKSTKKVSTLVNSHDCCLLDPKLQAVIVAKKIDLENPLSAQPPAACEPAVPLERERH